MDITLCISKKCPHRKKCGRAIVQQSTRWQSYADFSSTIDESGKCEAFLPHKPSDKK